jgi:hypothetical protein
MVRVSALVAVPPRLSITLKVIKGLPVAVGVPEITPVVVLSVKPVGS